MKNIKFHIDDYGVLPSINSQIINHISKNKIDSVSYICNSKYSSSYLKKFKEIVKKKKINVSCHLNLTQFGAKKYKLTFLKLLFYSFFPNLKIKKIINRLIKVQLNFFLSNIKIKNKTVLIDGHQHVHIFPIVQSELEKIFKKKKINYKLRNSNESIFFHLHMSKIHLSILNYIKLFLIKIIYLIFKQNKNFLNTEFIGIICTGIQTKKSIIKGLSNINKHHKGQIQILFHPFRINHEYLDKLNLNINNYKYFISKDRNIEISFLNNIKSKKNFLKTIL
tara:strand:+ start:115 stop:951 length:837 start_codon:yes stop_codon:yes gene_type:complete